MPEPVSKYSSDKVIYNITKKISPNICYIKPNVISVVGFLFTIPIIYNYEYNRSFIELIILSFIKQFLDCLDGTVARSCNTGTIFGAKLDISLDLLTSILISIYVLYNIIYYPPKEAYKIIIVLLIISSVIYYLGKYLCDKQYADKNNIDIDSIKMDPIATFFHDNSMIFSILTFILLKKLII